jgi:hypothetical protein
MAHPVRALTARAVEVLPVDHDMFRFYRLHV